MASQCWNLGCGSGSVTLAIAQAGFCITGLDLSAKMLAQAEEKIAKLPDEVRSRVTVVQGNMTNFDLDQRFLIIPFRPFQYLLEVQRQLHCLGQARKHLEPNGRLILDFFQTDARRMHDPEFLEERQAAEYFMPDGRTVGLSERVR